MGGDGALRFAGAASADAPARNRLLPALALLGRPGPDGSVPLQWPLSEAPPGESVVPESNEQPTPKSQRESIHG